MVKKLFFILAIILIPQMSLAQRIQYSVPFVSQAPRGNWKDAVFKDACEETSLLMAQAWIFGQQIDPVWAEQQIHQAANWEKQRFGFHQDTSVADTYVLATEYFHLPAELVENIGVEEVKQALADKSLVITAIDGSKLYLKGPPRHMIVVSGFDETSNEFIYSDPMKAQGMNLRVSSEKFQNALRDYPSGIHRRVNGQSTAMIKIYWPWIMGP
ncbi:MAG: C39 family peptidase [Candidatus Doudnabacteria bacterium]|nr:C39 family peptidase [Candidatus Doudnabacteria bacterium]